ncbi:GDP-L-fucose synthase [Campylobacter lari]|uniref:GDP-L-fucose synthase family protein n=1 Tax=Campylobacter lari TaxID=201 RepID=UPI0012BE61AF|nr:GDP-L-fucose synthase [Campylobacter lari]EAK0440357.1 GDP-L-fucose synthase [Campylobacter lari]EIY6495299.1 GDP-L-fucose synthase [Campylobacter lari]MCV3467217.1 GDP-L-fucose synthase [Campylobacter lari]MCV3534598.1 GDP-L-fucose synthase [Campylobacter lari]MCW0205262.1 GDP-L-fucose synthase [Campylobacter lari]
MEKKSKIYIAGHRGLVGSAIVQELCLQGYTNLIFKSHEELDLTNQHDVDEFFKKEKPEYVFLAAAKAGGIMANNTYRADFIYENLQIQCNVIHSAYKYNVKKLVFIASTVIYPKNVSLPTNEEQMLTGELEYTNMPYSIAKIAGIRMCESYNLQHKTNFISVAPINLYGSNDKFDLEKSHVLPALVKKMHLAKLLSENKHKELLEDLNCNDINEAFEYLDRYNISERSVEIWGSGLQTREFLHSDDLAQACVYIMRCIDFEDLYKKGDKEVKNTHINIGVNKNISIKELAYLVKKIVGFKGELFFNTSKPDGFKEKLTDCSKIHSLGWKHKIELEEGIKMMYDWYLKNITIEKKKKIHGGGYNKKINYNYLPCDRMFKEAA